MLWKKEKEDGMECCRRWQKTSLDARDAGGGQTVPEAVQPPRPVQRSVPLLVYPRSWRWLADPASAPPGMCMNQPSLFSLPPRMSATCIFYVPSPGSS